MGNDVGSVTLPSITVDKVLEGTATAGFVQSWKSWKSHGILKWLFPGLEKSLKKK